MPSSNTLSSFPYRALSRQQYDLYSGHWKVIVNSPDHSLLRDCFLNSDRQFATHVGYSAPQISRLVSTVGAHSIEARFVCGPASALSDEQSFGVVLYAADRGGNALSSYQVAYGTDKFLDAPGGSEVTPDNDDLYSKIVASDGDGAVQVPHYLAACWMQNWKCIWSDDGKCKSVIGTGEGVKRDMFVTAAGTLQGYSFSIGDLLQSLFNAQVENLDFYMLFNFCLHEYYPQATPDAPKYTFGLVIRLYDANGMPTAKRPGTTLRLCRGATTAGAAEGGGGSNEPFYDMSYPRPPYGDFLE